MGIQGSILKHFGSLQIKFGGDGHLGLFEAFWRSPGPDLEVMGCLGLYVLDSPGPDLEVMGAEASQNRLWSFLCQRWTQWAFGSRQGEEGKAWRGLTMQGKAMHDAMQVKARQCIIAPREVQ